MKLVLDTNVFVSALLKRSSVPGQILQAWRDGRYDLLVSDPLYEELSNVLRRRKIKAYLEPELARRLLELIRDYATWVEVAHVPSRAVRDPKDLMVLGTALGGKARFVVTGDEDLLVLRSFRGIRILTPKEALEVIGGR